MDHRFGQGLADLPHTVDWLLGWANDRFGLDIPRFPDIAQQPSLAAVWALSVDPPPDPAHLPFTVAVHGSWVVMTGLTLEAQSITFCNRT